MGKNSKTCYIIDLACPLIEEEEIEKKDLPAIWSTRYSKSVKGKSINFPHSK